MNGTWSVGKKFGLTGAFLIGMLILMGALTLLGLRTIDRAVYTVAEDSLKGLSACSRLEADVLDSGVKTLHHISVTDPARMRAIEAEIDALREKVAADLRDVQAAITTNEERQLNAPIGPAIESFYREWARVIDLSRAGQNEDAHAAYTVLVTPEFETARAAVAAESEYNRRSGAEHSAAALKMAANITAGIWAAAGITTLLGILLLAWVVRGVNRGLSGAVRELTSGARQVAAAAAQVSTASQSLSQGASEQAASLEETSSSGEEISSMARQNAEHSHAAAAKMAEAGDVVSEANRSLDQMLASMEKINESSGKISKIIKVIDEVAFQTNILALNAAVEAARAGEAGMGFAVVADEVRTLAQRCAQAARDTSAMIEESIAHAAEGKQRVDQVAAGIRAMTENAGAVAQIVDEIKVGSEEQARGIEQVSRAVIQMQSVTQTNAASAEQSAAASEELNAQAEALRGVVDRLTAMIAGASR